MLNAAVPIFSTVVAAVLLRSLPRFRQAAGVALGFVGTVGIGLPAARGSSAAAWGVLLVVAATVCYGIALNLAVPLQQRYGAAPDGVVGPETLAALNLPVAERVRQLALNLERLRWMPADLGEDFVYINLADASLRLVESGKPRLDLRIAVGRPFRGTPIFSPLMLSPTLAS